LFPYWQTSLDKNRRSQESSMSESATLPLLGKTALVTGSARGIGAAIAWKLATEGADVSPSVQSITPSLCPTDPILAKTQIIIHHLTPASTPLATSLANRIRALPHHPSVLQLQIDISTPTGPSEIISEIQNWRAPAPLQLDILINNAGIAPPALLSEITQDHITSILSTNLQAPLLTIQAAAPYLRAPARIISISSIAARQFFKGLTVYAASKAGLEAITRHLAHELGGDGTTVNCVTPGAVESELLRETEKKIPGIVDAICASTPLQHRVGTPEEFAQVVAWLCRAEAGWITGQVISATGGQAMY
jgi:3-oxoacyl-[acyl-carrier protein] reductase